MKLKRIFHLKKIIFNSGYFSKSNFFNGMVALGILNKLRLELVKMSTNWKYWMIFYKCSNINKTLGSDP